MLRRYGARSKASNRPSIGVTLVDLVLSLQQKSRRPVVNREDESSCTFVQGVEKSGPIPNAVKLLSRFIKTVATAVQKNVPIVETL